MPRQGNETQWWYEKTENTKFQHFQDVHSIVFRIYSSSPFLDFLLLRRDFLRLEDFLADLRFEDLLLLVDLLLALLRLVDLRLDARLLLFGAMVDGKGILHRGRYSSNTKTQMMNPGSSIRTITTIHQIVATPNIIERHNAIHSLPTTRGT